MLEDKRIRIILGHYGSGKTEFAVNYVLKLSEIKGKITIVDLDIINTYFRSREKEDLFSQRGIELIGSSVKGRNITAELPALAPNIYRALQDDAREVIIDVGGDSVGAKILAQYKNYFNEDNCELFFVVNANRPETDTSKKVREYIEGIEAECKMKTTGLINNTHMLQYTTKEDIIKGNDIVSEISQLMNIPVKYTCFIKKIEEDIPKEIAGEKFIIDMIMREKWMLVE